MTFDWYAQDKDGNVWYLGEDSTEFEGDKIDTAGSWESGVDGALPGIIMQADPTVGDAYRQEFYEGEAEDLAEIVRIGETASVPFGSYDGLLVIREWNPLEPDVVEEKLFARVSVWSSSARSREALSRRSSSASNSRAKCP